MQKYPNSLMRDLENLFLHYLFAVKKTQRAWKHIALSFIIYMYVCHYAYPVAINYATCNIRPASLVLFITRSRIPGGGGGGGGEATLPEENTTTILPGT
jgi:hypothetical protein